METESEVKTVSKSAAAKRKAAAIEDTDSPAEEAKEVSQY